MQAFVVHYTPLVDRKNHINNLFNELDIKPKFITKYDRENLLEFSNIYNFSEERWNQQINEIKDILLKNSFCKSSRIEDKFNLFAKNRLNYFYRKFILPKWMKPRKLKLSEISLTLKHYSALKKIENFNEPALIVEDDIVLKADSLDYLKQSFLLCSKKFDYIDLGGGCDLPFYKDDRLIQNTNKFISLAVPRSRTTAAYMITPAAAKKLAIGIFPITMPIDWQYQYIFKKMNFKVSWSYPSGFIHGSQKHFKSSIN